MTSPATRLSIRCVVVALDNASLGHDTMQAAVNLAADLEVELRGIYVEDETLVRIAELPFVHEITTCAATERPIDAQSMRRALARTAEQIRHKLEQRAAAAQIRCSFDVTHGRASLQVPLATSDNEVFFFGCRSHVPRVRPPLGLHPRSTRQPIMVLVDESPRGRLALTTAALVAHNHARPVVLLLATADPGVYRQLAAAASQLLCDQEIAHALLPHPVVTTAALIRSTREQRCDLLLLSRASALLSESPIEWLVDQLDCSLALV